MSSQSFQWFTAGARTRAITAQNRKRRWQTGDDDAARMIRCGFAAWPDIMFMQSRLVVDNAYVEWLITGLSYHSYVVCPMHCNDIKEDFHIAQTTTIFIRQDDRKPERETVHQSWLHFEGAYRSLLSSLSRRELDPIKLSNFYIFSQFLVVLDVRLVYVFSLPVFWWL